MSVVPHREDPIAQQIIGRQEAQLAEARRLLSEARRVLGIARDRAISLGNICVQLGGVDMNRGQFASLMDTTDESIRAFLSQQVGQAKEER